MPRQFPTDPVSLIAFLIEIGIVLTEDDKQKIREGMLADQAETEALVNRVREQSAPMGIE